MGYMHTLHTRRHTAAFDRDARSLTEKELAAVTEAVASNPLAGDGAVRA